MTRGFGADRQGHTVHAAAPPGAPDVLVARQPILDRDANVVAYELLARRALDAGAWSGGTDDSRTTARVIGQAFLDMDVWSITEGLPAFVNFTRELLLDDTVDALPPELTVVEILETVVPDAAVARACRRLRRAGYRIALDDVVAGDPRLSLLGVVDVVKVDFAATSPAQRGVLLTRCHDAGVRVLAEKVETRQQHQEARALGCDLFQGYFFCKPAVVGGRKPVGERLLHLQLLRSVTAPRIDTDAVGNVLARDAGAAARFQRLLGDRAADPTPGSVRAALAGLDQVALARLVALLVVVWLGERHPRPLLDTALIRARFCETLAGDGEDGTTPLDGYLAGLCSLLDALIGEPLDAVLARIHPDPRLVAACLRGEGRLGRLLELVRAYEHGDWSAVRACSSALRIDGAALGPLYLECLAWSRDLLGRAGSAMATPAATDAGGGGTAKPTRDW